MFICAIQCACECERVCVIAVRSGRFVLCGGLTHCRAAAAAAFVALNCFHFSFLACNTFFAGHFIFSTRPSLFSWIFNAFGAYTVHSAHAGVCTLYVAWYGDGRVRTKAATSWQCFWSASAGSWTDCSGRFRNLPSERRQRDRIGAFMRLQLTCDYVTIDSN